MNLMVPDAFLIGVALWLAGAATLAWVCRRELRDSWRARRIRRHAAALTAEMERLLTTMAPWRACTGCPRCDVWHDDEEVAW